MFFLIRMAFWFSLVLLFLPMWPGKEGTGVRPVGAIEAFSAAQRAIGDISRICEREPEVCVTGAAAAQTISVRARDSARVAGAMLEQYQGLDDVAVVIDGNMPTPTTAIIPPPRPVR